MRHSPPTGDLLDLPLVPEPHELPISTVSVDSGSKFDLPYLKATSLTPPVGVLKGPCHFMSNLELNVSSLVRAFCIIYDLSIITEK